MSDVDSDNDLTKDLQPLAYHVSDRKRVLKEALRSLKGKRLDAMIPPLLKGWDREKLEYACLDVLEELSDETLAAILDGRVGTAGVAAVEQPTPTAKVPGAKSKKLKKLLAKSVGDESATAADEPKKKKKKKGLAEAQASEVKHAKLKKKKKAAKTAKIKGKGKKKKKGVAATATGEESAADGAPAPHKSLMELLELEYRAKAIKALLRSQGQTVPDIPINLEDENSGSGDKTVDAESQKNNTTETSSASTSEPPPPSTKAKASKGIPKLPPNDVPKVASQAAPAKPAVRVSPASKTITKKKIAKRSSSDQKSDINKNLQPSSTKSLDVVEKPKKAVIDLIDEALNSSFSAESEAVCDSNNTAVIEPPSAIIEVCARKDMDGESLRQKLLQKYQNQRKQKTRRKKKPDMKEQEDILDLHPQELSLTDEDRAGPAENETTESSESEADEPDSSSSPHGQTKISQVSRLVKASDEEELNYDEDTEEDEEMTEEKPSSTTSNPEKNNEANDSVATSEKGEEEPLEKDMAQESGDDEYDHVTVDSELTSRDGPPSESSRPGIEALRDDVFESATEAFPQSSKRKITFRIDPARIGVLEEQGAEEEAKKIAEQQREEEERLQQLEVEEGEIDSNEDFSPVSDRATSPPPPPKPQSTTQKSSSNEAKKCASRKTSKRRFSDSDDNSDDSYTGKRSYKTHTESDRDFGTYSPKGRTDTDTEAEPSKRPSSPVEFITQFSDMEPISDDDSQQSASFLKSKRSNTTTVTSGVVQGCAPNPSGVNPSSPQASSEDDDQETKPDGGDDDSRPSAISGKGSGSNNEKSDSEDDEREATQEDEMPKPITWFERWAQSHGMQKVVKTNKIHKKVRNKLKEAVNAKKKPELPKDEPSIEAEPIIGSIQEYEKLFGKKVVNKELEKSAAEQDEVTSSSKEDDTNDKEDDDADDDLWGDIIGGS